MTAQAAPRIYVAGGMREKEAVSLWMIRLREAGFHITCDWTQSESNGYDADLDPLVAANYARADLEGVRTADFVWHIVANYEGSRGAYVETGYALARHIPLYVSGPTWKKSIFHRLAFRAFDEHAGAFQVIVEHARLRA